MIRYYTVLVLLLLGSFSNAQSFRWAKKAGSVQNDYARNITTDNSNNIYYVGWFYGTINFDSAGFTRSLVSAGGEDIYIAKVNCAKNLMWANRIGSSQDETGAFNGIDIKYDKIGNIYVSGAFQGSATFTSTSGSSQIKVSAGDNDVFLAKYDTLGVLQWVVQSGGFGSDEGLCVNIDNVGNVVLGGLFGGDITIGTTSGSTVFLPHTGAADGFLAKYSPAGALAWATRIYSFGDDLIATPSFDANNNIYVAGNFGCCGSNTTTFGSLSISNNGGWGAYVAKASPNGTWLWVNGTGSSSDEGGSGCLVDSGYVYFTGHFSGNAASMSSSSGPSVAMPGIGSYDVFLAKFDTSGVLQWVNVDGSTGNDYSWGLIKNKRNNIVIYGGFSGTANFSGPFLTSAGGLDIYLSEYTNSGSGVWTIKAGGTGDDQVFGLTCDDNGSLFICGSFSSTTTFGPSTLSSSGSEDSYIAKISPGASFQINTPAPICIPDSALIKPITTLPANGKISWLRNGVIISGQNNDSLYAKLSGVYRMIITNACNESDTSLSVSLSVSSIAANAGNDTTIVLGDSASFHASGGTTYSWSPTTGLSNPNIANPKASPLVTTQYIVTVTNGACSQKDTIIVTVNQPQPGCSYTDVLSQPNLVVNSGFESGNTGFSTPLVYYTSSPLDGGEYIVTNNPSSIHFAYNGTDHTSGSGNMLVVNGPSNITNVWCQTITVQPNTYYRVGAWFNNIVNHLTYPGTPIAYMELSINGTKISKNISLPDLPDAWVLLDTLWFSGSNTSVSFCIKDTSTSGNGNDFAVDDVFFKECVAPVLVTPLCENCTSVSPLNNGLVVCYPFNGNANDESGTGNNGAASSGTVLTSDRDAKPSSAYTFDGTTNAYIQAPASASINTGSMSGITFSCWFNAGSITGGVSQRRIFNLQDGSARNYDLNYNYTTNILEYVNFTGSSSAVLFLSAQTFTPGVWYFVTVRINGPNTTELFINGVLDNSSSNTIVKPVNPVFAIGRHPVNGWNFSGKIDDVRMYNRAISNTEINQIYRLKPPITATAGIDTTICNGDSIQLVATGGTSYKWTPSATLNKDTIYNPFAKPFTTTDYIVTVTSGSCSAKDTVKVTVDAPVTVNAGTDQNLCTGDSIQLTATGATKYKWTPSLTLSNDTLPNPYAKPTITTDYIVTGTSGACSDKDTVKVSVSSVTADAGTGQLICIGDSIQLTATGGTQYAWLNNGTLSDTSIANPYANPSATTLYTVQVSDGICTKQDTVTVTVVTGASLNAGTDKTICEKDSVQLLATGGGNYTWSPNVGIDDTASATPKVSPAVTTEYMVVSTVGSCVARDTIVVNVNTLPAVSAGLDVIVCPDVPYPIPAISSNANQYLWTPSTFLNDATLLQPVVTADNTTQYVIKATNTTTSCSNYDTLLVTVSNPQASFTATPLTGTIPFDVQFTNTSIASNPTYTWYFEDVDSFYNDENPLHTYRTRGTFLVSLLVTDENGCTATDTLSIEALDELKVFIPNVFTPNGDSINDYFVISYTQGALDKMTGTIWNRWGAKVYEFEMPNGVWWDGTEGGQICAEGVYYYIVQTKDNQGRIKKYHGTVTLLR